MTTMTMTKGDIDIVLLEPECCGDCEERATHRLSVEVRTIGVTFYEGAYCESHATERCDAARAHLPDDEPEDRREIES